MANAPSLFDRWPTMARDLGHSRQRVHVWRTTRRIPVEEQRRILGMAFDLGLTITAEDVIWPFPEDRGTAQ